MRAMPDQAQTLPKGKEIRRGADPASRCSSDSLLLHGRSFTLNHALKHHAVTLSLIAANLQRDSCELVPHHLFEPAYLSHRVRAYVRVGIAGAWTRCISCRSRGTRNGHAYHPRPASRMCDPRRGLLGSPVYSVP